MFASICKSIYLPPDYHHMKTSKTYAFTLIELLVVISIIAILAGIALPVFGQVQIKGAQTKALSNAKQIATALKLYAVDNNGNYPSYQLTAGQPANPPVVVTTSNDAFCQVIPDYVPTEDIFWLAKSKWCTGNGPDNQIDNPMVSPSTKTLAPGENEWAYVTELTDTSNAAMPLIADGFITGGDSGSHQYSTDVTKPGGVWQAKVAIVVHVDASAAVLKVDKTQLNVQGYNGGTTNGDIFLNSNGTNGWLGSTNTTVNPKPPGG